VAALVIAIAAGPAVGYEIDIYAVYPIYFWVLLGLAYFVSLLLVMRGAFYGGGRRYGLIGIISIVCANSLILLIPFLRGYYFYGTTDAAQYLGFTQDIQTYGNIGLERTHIQSATYTPIQDVYPAFPILISVISALTGLESRVLAMLMPFLFFIFYQFSIFILAHKLTHNFQKALLALAFAFPTMFLFLQSMCMPSVLLFFYSPFVIFVTLTWLTDRGREISWLLLVIVSIMVIPFSHPGDAISILIILFCIEFIRRRSKTTLKVGSVSAILSIIWFVWVSSIGVFAQSITSIFSGVSFGDLFSYLQTAGRANVSLLTTIDLFLRNFGQEMMYFAVSGLILISLILMRRRRKPTSHEYLYPLAIFLIFLILTPFFILIPGVGTYRRVIYYAVLGSTLLNAFFFYDWYTKAKFKKMLFSLITCIIFLAMLLSMFNVHASPFIKQSNQQITYSDALGMNWFFLHNNDQNPIDQIRITQYSLSAINLGVRETPRNIRWGTSNSYQALDHFAYTEYNQYGQAFTSDRYFLSSKLDRDIFPTIFPEYQNYWRWTDSDWRKLVNDPSVIRTYDNLEFYIFYIKGS